MGGWGERVLVEGVGVMRCWNDEGGVLWCVLEVRGLVVVVKRGVCCLSPSCCLFEVLFCLPCCCCWCAVAREWW